MGSRLGRSLWTRADRRLVLEPLRYIASVSQLVCKCDVISYARTVWLVGGWRLLGDSKLLISKARVILTIAPIFTHFVFRAYGYQAVISWTLVSRLTLAVISLHLISAAILRVEVQVGPWMLSIISVTLIFAFLLLAIGLGAVAGDLSAPTVGAGFAPATPLSSPLAISIFAMLLAVWLTVGPLSPEALVCLSDPTCLFEAWAAAIAAALGSRDANSVQMPVDLAMADAILLAHSSAFCARLLEAALARCEIVTGASAQIVGAMSLCLALVGVSFRNEASLLILVVGGGRLALEGLRGAQVVVRDSFDATGEVVPVGGWRNLFTEAVDSRLSFARGVIFGAPGPRVGIGRCTNRLNRCLAYARVDAPHTGESACLHWVVQMDRNKKLDGMERRAPTRRARILLEARRSVLSHELLARLDRQGILLQRARHKLRHVWEAMLQGNAIEVGRVTEQARRTFQGCELEWLRLVITWHNNGVVMHGHARLALEILAGPDRGENASGVPALPRVSPAAFS